LQQKKRIKREKRKEKKKIEIKGKESIENGMKRTGKEHPKSKENKENGEEEREKESNSG
jgi:hypothetical protein